MSYPTRSEVPDDALLKTYPGGRYPARWGRYADCFAVRVHRAVSLSAFVVAFYTTPVFRLERLLLSVLAGAPSSDTEALALAAGTGETFAVWRVGARNAQELLMCDRYDWTRSWFRVSPVDGGATLLQFGSAVAASAREAAGAPTMGRGFRWLLAFHIQYSKLLLWAAGHKVMRAGS